MNRGFAPVPPNKVEEHHTWREWFTQLQAVAQSSGSTISPSTITSTGSPYVYQNTNTYPVDVHVTGGTVSDVSFSRDGSTYYSYGTTTGMYHLSQYDYIKVTYTVAPTITQIPR